MSDSKPKARAKPKAKKPAAAKPKPEVVEAPKPEPDYLVGKWNKLPHYQCTRCPWSTLSEDEMIRHVANHLSATQPTVRRTDTGFVNTAGEKIVREETIPPPTEE